MGIIFCIVLGFYDHLIDTLPVLLTYANLSGYMGYLWVYSRLVRVSWGHYLQDAKYWQGAGKFRAVPQKVYVYEGVTL